MESYFEKSSLKSKLTYILLYCLSYGCRIGSSAKETKKRLKVEFEFDAKRIRSCIDLIQDTEGAIFSFSEYGLQKFSFNNVNGDGELYLRLYGILNAIYLQLNSIIELYDVLKIPGKKKVINRFKELEIYEIRNVVASHTVNYMDSENISPKGFSKNFFRITQMFLTAKSEEMNAVDGFDNVREYNLYNSFLEYNRVSEEILYDCVTNYFERIIINKTKRDDLFSHYEINGLEHFNYEILYKNDKLYRDRLNNISEELKMEDEEFDEEMNVDSNISIEKLQDLLETDVTSFKEKVTPPNKS
ncbi:hypothetical protein EO244_16590 [Ancylomarina salipaludis]|uniref:Uncharacterized protein n=1 Tax=Ancylomarina salipaludis TaxID=2501299 RepID=A0A4Q1JHI9_9BACT|nr:hypothetical protein [Ancylomarina salipaludis]RXQ87258.1 hypothetical protein EO244_16590 [Ancylomarina salipaludis]